MELHAGRTAALASSVTRCASSSVISDTSGTTHADLFKADINLDSSRSDAFLKPAYADGAPCYRDGRAGFYRDAICVIVR